MTTQRLSVASIAIRSSLSTSILVLLCWQLASVNFALSQDAGANSTAIAEPLVASDYVRVESGQLPIIISAPHGGNLSPPGVPARLGEGMEKGSSGFFTGRDTGTEELAQEVAAAIEQRFGKRPYLVASRGHRKYLDPNRPADIALEHPAIQPVYALYHDSLAKFCREVTNRYHAGVLIDIHGQGSRSDTVFRGTKHGLTVRRLRETFGQSAHDGPESLFGQLQSRGWIVYPALHQQPEAKVDKEQSGFTGGYIVQSYGSHTSQPIDAMQLEFGSQYRTSANRPRTAAILADALADYAKMYLSCEVPARTTELPTLTIQRVPPSKSQPSALQTPASQPSTSQTPEQSNQVQVALFVDAGVSSTSKLVELLNKDSSLAVSKVSAQDIANDALDKFAVLIHPGGSGSGQGKALGETGRAKVRNYIESGHGMVGICAGAYLASCDYEWSLHVLDAKVIDRQHWNRGSGSVSVAISQSGRELLKLEQHKIDLYYHQGPLLAPAADPAVPDFVELASYEGEIAKNGAQAGVMPGTTAIAQGTFGKGRVICFSPHPEKTPGYEELVLRGLHWAAEATVAKSGD